MNISINLPGKDHKLVNLLIWWCFTAIPNQLLQLLQVPGILLRCIKQQ